MSTEKITELLPPAPPSNSLELLGMEYTDPPMPSIPSPKKLMKTGNAEPQAVVAQADKSNVMMTFAETFKKKLEEKYQPTGRDSSKQWWKDNSKPFLHTPLFYVNFTANGHDRNKAMIDTGAQTSVISLSCLKRCGLTPLLNRSFCPRVVGLGTIMSLGIVRPFHFKLGGKGHQDVEVTTTCHVLEDLPFDMIIGMNVLSANASSLNFEKPALIMKGPQGKIEVETLPLYTLKWYDRSHVEESEKETDSDDNHDQSDDDDGEMDMTENVSRWDNWEEGCTWGSSDEGVTTVTRRTFESEDAEEGDEDEIPKKIVRKQE